MATFVVAFSLLFTNLSAQSKTDKAKVTEGPEVESKRSSVQDICGYDESGYYTVRLEKSTYYLEHINKQMVVDKSAKIVAQKQGQLKMEYNYCSMMEGNLYMYSTTKDTKTSTARLYVQSVSTSTLLPDNNPKEIASSAYVTKRFMMSSYTIGGSFSSAISPDESHLLIYSAEMSKDNNGDLQTDKTFHLTVLNSKMGQEWEKEIRLPYAPDIFTMEQIKLDDKGNVYIIGIEYQEKSEARISRREGKPSYTYHLFRYADKGSDVMEMALDLKGKFITDVQIDGAPNGDIIASGFYSETGTFSVKGAFYMSIDSKTREVKIKQLSEFPTDFITQYYSEREKKKEKKKEAKGDEAELYQFRLDNLLIREDGGVTLIAEQFFIEERTYITTDSQGRTTTRTVYYYNYNDILVLSFDKTGMVEWKTKIPKRQVTTNDGGYYSSYNFSVIGDKIYFIFNDNPKNLFLPKDQKPYPFSGSKELAVVLVEVDASGKSTKELLMTTEKGDLIVRPKMCKQTGAKEVLICSQKTKVYQFSKVVFK